MQRRQLILLLILTSSCLTIGLAVTNSLVAFEVLTFLTGVASVVPQVLVPLAADIAPMDRKAGAIAIVWAALLFGVLLARVLAGVITNFSSYRNVYYMATGLQFATLFASYILIPNVPAKKTGLNYFGILHSMCKLAFTEPLLIQCAISILVSNMCFTNFWVTLTFLLLDAPFHYSSYVSCFVAKLLFDVVKQTRHWSLCLAGHAGSCIGTFPWPLARLYLPLVWGHVCCALAARLPSCYGHRCWTQRRTGRHLYPWLGCVQTAHVCLVDEHGLLTVWLSCHAPCLGLNVFCRLDPAARSRVNAVMTVAVSSPQTYIYIISMSSQLFLGQVVGTAASTKVFLSNGWRACYGMALAWTFLQVVLLLWRGPHCPRTSWFGWAGGWTVRKSRMAPAAAAAPVAAKVDTPAAATGPEANEPTKNEKSSSDRDPKETV